MMGHDFSRHITKNVELNMKMGTIFWDTQNGNVNYIWDGGSNINYLYGFGPN